MRILFVHQNMPGQFGRLATALAADPKNEVAFVTRRTDRDLPGVLRASYHLRAPAQTFNAPIGASLYRQSLYGDAAVRSCQALLARGFKPDVVVGHPGWGELLFIKDLFPAVPLISYCEYYHRPGAPYFFADPPRPLDRTERMKRRAESAHLLLSLEAADRGWSPTHWQKSVHPQAYRDKIEVIFDGVDTDLARPDPAATFRLPDGRLLLKGDEILTYAARSLEPTRGFPPFYRALAELLKRRPNLQVLIAGGERPHYDAPPADNFTWAEQLRIEAPLDPGRVHFLGRLPYARYLRMLQVSRLHVYLTTPTVLSWSMLEAMSAGCAVLGSDTPPVTEFLREGETGHLTPFHNPEVLAASADRILAGGEDGMGGRAREFVQDRLSVKTCLPAQRILLESLAGV